MDVARLRTAVGLISIEYIDLHYIIMVKGIVFILLTVFVEERWSIIIMITNS